MQLKASHRKLPRGMNFALLIKKLSKLVYHLKREDGSIAGNWHIKDLKPYNDSVDLSEGES